MTEAGLVEFGDSSLKATALNGARRVMGGGVLWSPETAPAAKEDREEGRQDDNGENPCG